MALKDLSTEEMVTITGQWLDPERQKPIILRYPRLHLFLPDLDAAHAGVVVFQNKGTPEPPELPKLRARTNVLDARHDRLSRSVHHLLTGLIENSEDKPENEPLRNLHTELFPEGLSINTKTYLAQAGDAELRWQRLSDTSKRWLQSIVIRTPNGETRLATLVEEWGKVARELGDVESEKVRLQAGHGVESSRGPARRAWVNTVSFFLEVVERERSLTDDERRALLEPLRNAEAKAAKRRALARKKDQPFDPDAEVPELEV